MKITLTNDEVVRLALEYAREPPNDTKRFRDAFQADESLGRCLRRAASAELLTQDDLQEVARWKYRGAAPGLRLRENTDCEILELSNASFKARTERLRVGALLALPAPV